MISTLVFVNIFSYFVFFLGGHDGIERLHFSVDVDTDLGMRHDGVKTVCYIAWTRSILLQTLKHLRNVFAMKLFVLMTKWICKLTELASCIPEFLLVQFFFSFLPFFQDFLFQSILDMALNSFLFGYLFGYLYYNLYLHIHID